MSSPRLSRTHGRTVLICEVGARERLDTGSVFNPPRRAVLRKIIIWLGVYGPNPRMRHPLLGSCGFHPAGGLRGSSHRATSRPWPRRWNSYHLLLERFMVSLRGSGLSGSARSFWPAGDERKKRMAGANGCSSGILFWPLLRFKESKKTRSKTIIRRAIKQFRAWV